MEYFIDNYSIYQKEVLDTGHEITMYVCPVKELVTDSEGNLSVGNSYILTVSFIENKIINNSLIKSTVPYNGSATIFINNSEVLTKNFSNGVLDIEFEPHTDGVFEFRVEASNGYSLPFTINVS